MADRTPRRKSRRRQLKVSHQKNWLTGRHAVAEALSSAVWPIAELYVEETDQKNEPAELLQLAARHNIEPVVVSRDRLTELCGSRHHQGLAARMGDFPYQNFDDALPIEQIPPEAGDLIVMCDRIQDSHNFGAILRCCDAMNVKFVIVGSHQQSAVSPQVARSSAGAVNHVPIILTDCLKTSVEQLKHRGYHICAATEKTDTPAWSISVSCPAVLIVGNEAHGIDDELLERCDSRLMIPMMGQVGSLNVAVATGILLYELRHRQK